MSCLVGCGRCKFSKMPKGDEKATVGCILFLRFCQVITTACLAFAAKSLYQLVRDHKELQSPPYNKHILLAQHIVYATGMTSFVWLFVGFALILVFKGPSIFVYGIIDLTIAIALCVGVGLQAVYLPATHSVCGHAETWQVVSDHPSLFHLAASFQVKKTAVDSCHQFVSSWVLAVAVIVFEMITAYIGIFSDTREFSVLNPYRPFAWFVIIIFGLPYWLIAFVTPRARFTYRFIKKVVRSVRGLEEIEFEEIPKYNPNYASMTVSNPSLQRILNIEHLLLPIASGLDYVDLINLSLTSKSIRECVFPAGDLVYRTRKLKEYSCNLETKVNCLYCNKQVCEDCTITRNLPGLPGARHLSLCRPYCSRCYFKTIAPGVRRRGIDKTGCRCFIADASIQDQKMCRGCSDVDWQELQAARNKRYTQQLRDLAMGIGLPEGENFECAKCKGEIKAGARWWICTKCKGECISNMHPAWAGGPKGQNKEKDKEKELGDNNV